MLKKLTATGIVVAAAAGSMLLGGTANADRLFANEATRQPTSYDLAHHGGWSRWHHRGHWHGRGHWHHRDRHQHRFHFHR